MGILRRLITAIGTGCFLVSVAGCATGAGAARASHPLDPQAEHWKKKYEAEKSSNDANSFADAMEALSEGMEGISRSLDNFGGDMFK